MQRPLQPLPVTHFRQLIVLRVDIVEPAACRVVIGLADARFAEPVAVEGFVVVYECHCLGVQAIVLVGVGVRVGRLRVVVFVVVVEIMHNLREPRIQVRDEPVQVPAQVARQGG